MNHTRFPKEKHLPYWARRGNKDKKGDRVERNITLNGVRQHYFITEGNYIGYMFRL